MSMTFDPKYSHDAWKDLSVRQTMCVVCDPPHPLADSHTNGLTRKIAANSTYPTTGHLPPTECVNAMCRKHYGGPLDLCGDCNICGQFPHIPEVHRWYYIATGDLPADNRCHLGHDWCGKTAGHEGWCDAAAHITTREDTIVARVVAAIIAVLILFFIVSFFI